MDDAVSGRRRSYRPGDRRRAFVRRRCGDSTRAGFPRASCVLGSGELGWWRSVRPCGLRSDQAAGDRVRRGDLAGTQRVGKYAHETVPSWIRWSFCTLAVMQQRSTGTVTRSLLLLLLPFIALLAVPPLGSSGSAAVLGTAIAVFVVAALATSSKYELLQLRAVAATGPSDDERCLRGAFRRQSSPDAPGRPQPRAPGIGL